MIQDGLCLSHCSLLHYAILENPLWNFGWGVYVYMRARERKRAKNWKGNELSENLLSATDLQGGVK